MQVSRNSHLKIPKRIEIVEGNPNSIEDEIAVKSSLEKLKGRTIVVSKEEEKIKERDKDLEFSAKIPANSNDMIVITTLKKLTAYVIAATEKSPARFRGVFVNRMQNHALDALEYLLQANFIRLDSIENKKKREEYQKEAIIKLKMLGYISLLAYHSNCILAKQYRQISIQITETMNLIVAWKKSDTNRYQKKNNGF